MRWLAGVREAGIETSASNLVAPFLFLFFFLARAPIPNQ